MSAFGYELRLNSANPGPGLWHLFKCWRRNGRGTLGQVSYELILYHSECLLCKFTRPMTNSYIGPYVAYKSRLAARGWCLQKRNVCKKGGCLYFVPPSVGGGYFLHLLLNHIPDAASFHHLGTYHGAVYPSFHEA